MLEQVAVLVAGFLTAITGFGVGAVSFRFIGPALFVRMTLIVLASTGLIALVAALR